MVALTFNIHEAHVYFVSHGSSIVEPHYQDLDYLDFFSGPNFVMNIYQ